MHIAKVSGISVPETIARLKVAGLDPAGGGAGSWWTASASRWRREGGHQAVAMLCGGPSPEHGWHGHHDVRERGDLEDRVASGPCATCRIETGGFRAFIPWSFSAGRTALEGETEAATGVEYLTMLAVSRLYLDNVPHIQASWVTQGLKIGQVALRFGADDLGSTMIEENVVTSTGLTVQANRDDLVHAIKSAGFVPVQRRTDYSVVRVFEESAVASLSQEAALCWEQTKERPCSWVRDGPCENPQVTSARLPAYGHAARHHDWTAGAGDAWSAVGMVGRQHCHLRLHGDHCARRQQRQQQQQRQRRHPGRITKIGIIAPEKGNDGWNRQGVESAWALASELGAEIEVFDGAGYEDILPSFGNSVANGPTVDPALGDGCSIVGRNSLWKTGVKTLVIDAQEQGIDPGLSADARDRGSTGGLPGRRGRGPMSKVGTVGVVVRPMTSNWNKSPAASSPERRRRGPASTSSWPRTGSCLCRRGRRQAGHRRPHRRGSRHRLWDGRNGSTFGMIQSVETACHPPQGADRTWFIDVVATRAPSTRRTSSDLRWCGIICRCSRRRPLTSKRAPTGELHSIDLENGGISLLQSNNIRLRSGPWWKRLGKGSSPGPSWCRSSTTRPAWKPPCWIKWSRDEPRPPWRRLRSWAVARVWAVARAARARSRAASHFPARRDALPCAAAGHHKNLPGRRGQRQYRSRPLPGEIHCLLGRTALGSPRS